MNQVTVKIDARDAVRFCVTDVGIPPLIAKRDRRGIWDGNHIKIIGCPSDLVRRSSDHQRQVNDSINLEI